MFLVSDSLFLQHVDVEIYALFSQFFCFWKADSANFFALRMYAQSSLLQGRVRLNSAFRFSTMSQYVLEDTDSIILGIDCESS